LGQKLIYSDFENLAVELTGWRTDPELSEAERIKGSGLVLGFVKGLRLSARLIYALRKSLSEFPVDVDWGHLLDLNEDSISPECDIIVHHKGIIQEWNGSNKPVMDFKFIQCNHAIAIINCKSHLTSIDKTYYSRLKPYVEHILLFAECCTLGKTEALKRRAQKVGYTGLWHLYSFERDTGTAVNEPKEWKDFLITLKKICLKKT